MPAGFHTYDRCKPTHCNSVFDLASLTKAVSTTAAIMLLVGDGRLTLQSPVRDLLPEFRGTMSDRLGQESRVTVKHLLTHTSGLPAWRPFYREARDPADCRQHVLNTPIEAPPGTQCVYSDLGFIILGILVEQIAGQPLDGFVSENVFSPLGMARTGYAPGRDLLDDALPTEIPEGRQEPIRGRVHDENAAALGGVAGHAGVFSTAPDLALFSQAMLFDSQPEGRSRFDPDTVSVFTRKGRILPESSRCLGWHGPSGAASGGVYLSNRCFGHTGFTGTSMWLDPINSLYVILLTNAVHPRREAKTPTYFDWRQRVHAAVYEVLGLTRRNQKLKWRPRWREPKARATFIQT